MIKIIYMHPQKTLRCTLWHYNTVIKFCIIVAEIFILLFHINNIHYCRIRTICIFVSLTFETYSSIGKIIKSTIFAIPIFSECIIFIISFFIWLKIIFSFNDLPFNVELFFLFLIIFTLIVSANRDIFLNVI